MINKTNRQNKVVMMDSPYSVSQLAKFKVMQMLSMETIIGIANINRK